jgi:protein-S-isoprenylcysteine O-methyltransferase Ste14
MFIALIGAAIVSRSIVGLASTSLVFLPVEIHRARLEERALADAFPELWREYASRTGFFLPRLRRHAGPPPK